METEAETGPSEEHTRRRMYEGKVRILGGNHLIAAIQELMAEEYPISDALMQ